jgi:hypothetical protein
LTQPHLTQSFSPLFIENGKMCRPSSVQLEYDLLAGVLAGLPKLTFQIFSIAGQPNFLPFYWSNYQISPVVSYVIKDISDTAAVLNNFNPSKKRVVTKSIDQFTFQKGLDVDVFCRLTSERFDHQLNYPAETLKKSINACRLNNCGEVYYLTDKQGAVNCALFVVWDAESAYNLVIVNVPQFKQNRSLTYLLFKVIEDLNEKTKMYDFEGSVDKNIEASIRTYGGSQRLYYTCKKKNLLSNLLLN